MDYIPVNLNEKAGKINELWSPKIVAMMNDYHFK
ncbi:MAG: cupin, partial [Ignavibacteriae bacterium HGW-Ignavibacteriae-3]